MGMALVIPKPLPHFALDHVIGHSGTLTGQTGLLRSNSHAAKQRI
jgi:hypothetical protein